MGESANHETVTPEYRSVSTLMYGPGHINDETFVGHIRVFQRQPRVALETDYSERMRLA